MSALAGFDMPQPFSPPSGGQIQPGAITYTTSTGPDGQVLYHPFSYQTPQGVVHGIQWVPAEATQILPAGATPANAEFAASWNRGYLSRDDEKALEKWQKSEEKRRKKEEKDSIRRLSKQFDKDMQEVELRTARDREIQTRERRRSFYGDAPPPGYGAPGSATYGAYTHSPSNVSSVDLDRKFTDLEIERDVKYTTRQRKYSTGGDRTSLYGPPAPGSVYSSPAATYQNPSGYPPAGSGPYNRAPSPFRQPTTYSTSPNPRPQEVSSYPEPIARAASPYGQGYPPYSARAPSPIPPSRGLPQRSTSPFPRAPSPYAPQMNS
ncbi:hypothetical protein J3R82DRAFT_4505 [Butyriboletus roseoflavus]|nr:hypothetical protein J3R82DRAFT_4505 [Butyriboletus roseoflavus]